MAHTPLTYGAYIIPAHTPISMTHYSLHHDERIFPNSHSFIPDRWLNDPEAPVYGGYGEADPGKDRRKHEKGPRTKRLSKYMASFSRGTRQCIGLELAWAQLLITVANLIRRCDMEIFETEFKDVGFMRDFGAAFPAKDARGLRVLVKNVV